jgi:dTDP-4-amino-4,6-dideoxygalactose transaminase
MNPTNPTNSTNPTNPISVPVLDLKRQYEAIKAEMDAAILDVVGSAKYVLGPYVAAFEEKAAAYCEAGHAIGVASGTDALLLSLRALGIGPGDAVILPSFTFFATAGVVHNVGATPVFCDIDPNTFNLDPDHVREILSAGSQAGSSLPVAGGNTVKGSDRRQAALSRSHKRHATGGLPRFRAIIPVHLYGQIADMAEVLAIAEEYGLAVVEDAAQAIGATYWGAKQPVARGSWPVENTAASEASPEATSHMPQASREPQPSNDQRATGHELGCRKAGTIGDLGCFSFYPTKNLGAYGDAGMITTNDDDLADTVRMLRVHGARPKYLHRMVGVNSRLDAIQAAILTVKLAYLDRWSTARAVKADVYDAGLADLDDIKLPHRADDRIHIFHQYTIRVLNGQRDALREHLKEQGVGTMIYYPKPLHLQECFAHLGYKEGQLPHSEAASAEVLSLPIFPEITEVEQAYVVEMIKKFFG